MDCEDCNRKQGIHTIHTIRTIRTIYTIYTIHLIHTIHTIHTKAAMETVANSVESIVPFVLASLQQPNCDIRCTAVNCLGLLCITSEEICRDNRGILLQVASGDFEEEMVQRQALESLVDMALVYRDLFMDDVELGNVVTRLQNNPDRTLACAASECAARLLFSGVQHNSRLFANLLKTFFLTDLQQADQGVNSSEAHTERLQQFLSLFLTSFMSKETIQEAVVLESIALFVADVTMEIKDGHVSAVVLLQMVKHLLTLCSDVTMTNPTTTAAVIVITPNVVSSSSSNDELKEPNEKGVDDDDTIAMTVEETTEDKREEGTGEQVNMDCLVKERVCAAVCREVVKMGTGKWLEKTIIKEFVKIINSMVTDEWLTPAKVCGYINAHV